LIKAQAEIDWFKNELARIKNGTSDEQKQLLQNEGETKSKKQNFTSQAQDRKVIEKLTFSIQEVKDLKEELRQAIELNRQLEKKLEYKKEELKEAEEQLKQTVDEVKFYQEKSIDLEKQLREAEEYISSGDECFKKISNDKVRAGRAGIANQEKPS
jgi:chromosome segregation ATPase